MGRIALKKKQLRACPEIGKSALGNSKKNEMSIQKDKANYRSCRIKRKTK